MKLTSISMAAALALTCAGASLAQPAPGGQPGPRAEGRHWQRPDPAQMAERRAEHLRAALQLRPDQEPALRAFVAASAPKLRESGKRREHEDRAPLTTPERLERMAARQAEHAQRFQARAEAVKRFYAQLSPAQQKAFDAMPMHMGRRAGHGEHGGHGWRRHGPGGPGGPGREGPPPPAGD